MVKTFAVVTGASKGLGKCFALELAERKINTILVALPNENLHLVAEQCQRLNVESYYYETDLTVKENILALTNWVNQNFNVNILINNAGCGGTKSFLECDMDFIDQVIQLNITATALITHQLIHNLMKQERSYILNVSSIASFSPMGCRTVYPASKRFVQHFSRGLNQELKGTNVLVSVLHPGLMKTNEAVTRSIELHGLFGKIGISSPKKVAEISLRQLFRNHSFILVGLPSKLAWLLLTLLPDCIKTPLLTKEFSREFKFDHS